MKKIIGFTFVAILITTIASAQTQNIRFSGGGGLVFGSGTGDYLKGYGLDIIAKKDIAEKIEGFAQIGYNSFSGSRGIPGLTANEITLNLKTNMIPMLVGVNYKAGNFRPGIGVGYTIGNASLDKSGSLASSNGLTIVYKGFDGGLSFNPQLSYNLNKIDLVANYFIVSSNGGNANGYGLKVYYNF
jgi:hypothetical protein